jgi:DNA-binding XRE family transcriptional regulator
MTQMELRRHQLRLSQADIALAADLATPTISNAETGFRPSMRTAERIAEVLECGVADLWEIESVPRIIRPKLA